MLLTCNNLFSTVPQPANNEVHASGDIDSLRKVVTKLPYKNKYWRVTKFGELVNRHAIVKFESFQYFFL